MCIDGVFCKLADHRYGGRFCLPLTASIDMRQAYPLSVIIVYSYFQPSESESYATRLDAGGGLVLAAGVLAAGAAGLVLDADPLPDAFFVGPSASPARLLSVAGFWSTSVEESFLAFVPAA